MEGWLARLRLFRVRVYNAKRQPYTERPMVVWFQMMQRLFWVFFSFTADIFHFITHLIDLHWKQSKTLRTKKKKRKNQFFFHNNLWVIAANDPKAAVQVWQEKTCHQSSLHLRLWGNCNVFLFFSFFLFFYACQTRVRVSDTYVQNQH